MKPSKLLYAIFIGVIPGIITYFGFITGLPSISAIANYFKEAPLNNVKVQNQVAAALPVTVLKPISQSSVIAAKKYNNQVIVTHASNKNIEEYTELTPSDETESDESEAGSVTINGVKLTSTKSIAADGSVIYTFQ